MGMAGGKGDERIRAKGVEDGRDRIEGNRRFCLSSDGGRTGDEQTDADQ